MERSPDISPDILAKLQEAADAGSQKARATLERYTARMAAEAAQIAADATAEAVAANPWAMPPAEAAPAAAPSPQPAATAATGAPSGPAAADAALAAAGLEESPTPAADAAGAPMGPAAADAPLESSDPAAAAGAADPAEAAADAALGDLVERIWGERDEDVVREAEHAFLQRWDDLSHQEEGVRRAINEELHHLLAADRNTLALAALSPGQRAERKLEHLQTACTAVYQRMLNKRPHAGADAPEGAAASAKMAQVKMPPASFMAQLAAAKARPAPGAPSMPGSSTDPLVQPPQPVPPKAAAAPPATTPCPSRDVRRQDAVQPPKFVAPTAEQIEAFTLGQQSAFARASAAADAAAAGAASAGKGKTARWSDHRDDDKGHDKGKGKAKGKEKSAWSEYRAEGKGHGEEDRGEDKGWTAGAKGRGKSPGGTRWRRSDEPRTPIPCYLCGKIFVCKAHAGPGAPQGYCINAECERSKEMNPTLWRHAPPLVPVVPTPPAQDAPAAAEVIVIDDTQHAPAVTPADAVTAQTAADADRSDTDVSAPTPPLTSQEAWQATLEATLGTATGKARSAAVPPSWMLEEVVPSPTIERALSMLSDEEPATTLDSGSAGCAGASPPEAMAGSTIDRPAKDKPVSMTAGRDAAPPQASPDATAPPTIAGAQAAAAGAEPPTDSTGAEMLTWALAQLDARKRALASINAEADTLRSTLHNAQMSRTAEREAEAEVQRRLQADVRRVEMVNKELRLQDRMAQQARAAQDGQITALCELFAKIATDLANAQSLLSKIAKRED